MTDRNQLLILDDDPKYLQFLGDVGRRHQYAVTTTSSIDQFRDAYSACPPSLILLDLRVQGGDGIQVLSFLRDRSCDKPIILISGFDDRVLQAARRVGEAFQLRIAAALTKPVRLATIGDILEAHREPDDEDWSRLFRVAIDEGQIVLFYQPKVALTNGRVIGFEALARWMHLARGMIGPDRFISRAEQMGLITPLTECVLEQAVTACASWSATGSDLSVAVNIAAPTLATDGIVERIDQLLLESELSPDRLTLEVTEGTAMQNPDHAMEVLGRLRLHGVSLALDDFGTGFSNLGLLHRMPFSELKIDKSFVIDVKENGDSQAIVKAIAGLASSLELTTVAEGVENPEIWPWLRSLGIAQAQGYAVARPMPADQVIEWLSAYSPPDVCLD